MPSIMIATPTAGDIVKARYNACIARTVSDLEAHGIGTVYRSIDASAIAKSRDAMTHMFLQSEATHILFTDSDMEWPTDLARNALSLGLPFIGAIYTKREISLEKIIKAAREGKDNPEAFGYTFLCRYLRQLRIDNGICEVASIGFGFVLLARECLTAMAASAPRYRSPILNCDVPGFFQELPDMGEDASFCHRWREVGGKVMAYADADIKHIGTFNYGVPFSQAAKAGAL